MLNSPQLGFIQSCRQNADARATEAVLRADDLFKTSAKGCCQVLKFPRNKLLNGDQIEAEILSMLHCLQAQMMILNHQYEAACEALVGASKSSGDMPDQRCVTLATALYGQGKQEEALQKLDQACKISPANVTALKNRATVKGAVPALALPACTYKLPHAALEQCL